MTLTTLLHQTQKKCLLLLLFSQLEQIMSISCSLLVRLNKEMSYVLEQEMEQVLELAK